MNIVQHDFGGGPVAERDYSPLLGTPFSVFISNGVKESLDRNGHSFVEITDLPGLITAIVQSRVTHPRKLSGDDLKFIRSALCIKAKEFAERVSMTPEHFSRCENGTKVMSDEKEKLYRMIAFLWSSVARDKQLPESISKEKILEEALSVTPKKAKKALLAFRKIFLEMSIDSVYPADEHLAFFFVRGHREDNAPCGDDDADWLDEG